MLDYNENHVFSTLLQCFVLTLFFQFGKGNFVGIILSNGMLDASEKADVNYLHF